MTAERQTLLARLPSVDRLLAAPACQKAEADLGRELTRRLARAAVERARRAALDEGRAPDPAAVEADLAQSLAELRGARLRRVVNASGVVLHTNLGRAPYGAELLDAARRELTGYVNLEIDLGAGRRGGRARYAHELLAAVCEAEAGLIVNNNAAALLLVLTTFAVGRETVVSRGELVQIGGGFRIPDILAASGAKLVEVGTTNITVADDYARALNPQTALLLKVHRSNFAVRGFTEEVSITDLARLERGGALIVHDLGSGCLGGPCAAALDEPTPRDSLRAGADLVCMSGDKLFGGPQAGLIVGRADLVRRLGRHPLMRALRPDKFTLFAVQETVRALLHAPLTIPAATMLAEDAETLAARVNAFLAAHPDLAAAVEPAACSSTPGAGSAPHVEMPSAGLAVKTARPQAASDRLRTGEPAVVGVIQRERLLLDFRTVRAEDEAALAAALRAWMKA